MDQKQLKSFLDKKVDSYNQPFFIASDPISVPHRFSSLQDREIAGFFAATFAWGNRTTIINKTIELMKRMDNAPHQFCLHHSDNDLRNLIGFKHRTFNDTDLLYFVSFLRHHYRQSKTLETAFTRHGATIAEMLTGFHQYFFSLEDAPDRTRKHIATPARGSTCKRLNMYLRWMVRKDNNGVDFGIWQQIPPAQLICPVDVHVARVARHFGMINRKQTDWLAAEELTATLRQFDSTDPVRYDFALFALGAAERYG